MTCGSAGFPRPHQRPRRARNGVSILELLGCIVAIVVGVWAGAAYLGVDLFALVGFGTEVASPEDDPAGAQNGTGGADAAGVTANAEQGPAENAKTPSPGKVTLDYWERLREIIREEQHVRAEGEQQAGSNPRAVLHAHSEAYILAAQNIRQIPTRSVDAEATLLAEDIAAWYDRGAELADEGSSLLDEGELSSAQGPIGRRWHTARKQHRAELDLLSRKCSSVRGKLTARYRLRFAELQ